MVLFVNKVANSQSFRVAIVNSYSKEDRIINISDFTFNRMYITCKDNVEFPL